MLQSDQYAVFGHPISHSKSPIIHRLFAQQTGQENLIYRAEDVAPEDFRERVEAFFAAGGKGLNCTIPLKELAFDLVDRKSEYAAQAGAVNTLSVGENGQLYGDNTDGIGLVNDLNINLGISLSGLNILVLGAGGACKGILGPIFDQQPDSVFIANRNPEKAIELAGRFRCRGVVAAGGFEQLEGQSFELIINSTSASLNDEIPDLPGGILKDKGYCYDLAYANQPTAFVRWGRQQNALVSVDGMGMLVEQAAEAFLIWRGIRPNPGAVIDYLNTERING